MSCFIGVESHEMDNGSLLLQENTRVVKAKTKKTEIRDFISQ